MPRDRELESILAAVAVGAMDVALFADWLEDRGDPRASLARSCVGRPPEAILCHFRQWHYQCKWVHVPRGTCMTLPGACANFGRYAAYDAYDAALARCASAPRITLQLVQGEGGYVHAVLVEGHHGS